MSTSPSEPASMTEEEFFEQRKGAGRQIAAGPEQFRKFQENKSNKFIFQRADELQFMLVDWLIEDILERNTLGLMFADPGAFKTFVALYMATAIATGTDWFGHKVCQGAVFIIAGEGHNGLKKRLMAWERHTGISLSGAPLYISNRAAQFYDTDAAAMVAEAIEDLVKQSGQKPALIIIDTLARNFGGGDENSTQDMNIYVERIDGLRNRWNVTILNVHHTGHGEKTRARGAMALKGAMDHEYCMTKDADTGIVTFQSTKTKDGPNPAPKYFELVKVPLEHPDGIIDGAALVEVNAPPATKSGRKLSPAQARAMQIFHNLAAEKGEGCIPKKDMPTVTVVRLDDFRAALRAGNISASTKPDSVNTAIKRAIESLNNKGITATWKDMIWAT